MSIRVTLSQADRITCDRALYRLYVHLDGLGQQLQRAILYGGPLPEEVRALSGRVQQLRNSLETNDAGNIEYDLPPSAAGLLRAALARERRHHAEQVQERQRIVSNRAVAEQLQESLAQFDHLLALPGVDSVQQERLPRLSDYVSTQGREEIEGVRELAKTERDPKHRALLSASILLSDLEVLRAECEDRGVSIGVAFVDIDDFKAFNTTLGEVSVDRYVLPSILNAVEAVAFGHGRAYRHGGDEVVLVLPNAGATTAVYVLTQLHKVLAALEFGITSLKAHASAGLWITVPQSHLTASELIDQASQAKTRSKSLGKSRITVRTEQGAAYDEQVIEA